MTHLGPYQLGYNDTPECGIYTGDARGLAQAIPDESVDLIFTDPIYWQIDDFKWLAETGARILKPGGSAIAYSGMLNIGDIIPAMNSALQYQYVLIERMVNTRVVIWKLRMFQQLKPLLWYSKGNPRMGGGLKSDFRTKLSEGHSVNHEWGKGLHAPLEWAAAFTLDDDVILDPFTGGGTVPAVCKMLGRRYLAFEIDPATADKARARIWQTQPPLFVPEATQAEMGL